MSNFDLKKFLTENKLTTNSRALISEIDERRYLTSFELVDEEDMEGVELQMDTGELTHIGSTKVQEAKIHVYALAGSPGTTPFSLYYYIGNEPYTRSFGEISDEDFFNHSGTFTAEFVEQRNPGHPQQIYNIVANFLNDQIEVEKNLRGS